MLLEETSFYKELVDKLPKDLFPLLNQVDGAAKLIVELQNLYKPEDIAFPTDSQRVWELSNLSNVP
jgi:hypothetical protein